MKDSAVVFVTDEGFLVPSLVSALQVLDQPEARLLADVIVVLIDIDPERTAMLDCDFRDRGLRFLSMPSSLFLPPDSAFFNKTHVPKTALGRLALHRVLPQEYQNVIYLDGDIQVVGDIAPLLRHRVAPQHVAAVPEGNWLCQGDFGGYWPKHRAYMAELGIDDARNYFNSGVLAFRLETWREMAPRALEYFHRHPERCLYHDQSALNAVFAGRLEPMSPAYNFASLYAELGTADELEPRIIHFTGGNKPWNYAGPPWRGRFLGVYRDFIEQYPQLSPYLSLEVQPDSTISRTSATGFLKARVLSPWRRRRRRSLLRRRVAGAEFVF
jgi:lipopolysaccharide biosynthesis glycosyltransferase